MLICENVDGDVNLGVFLFEKVDDEREVVGAKALTGMNSEASAFPLLEIPEVLLSLAFDLKDLIGETIKSLPCIREDHFLTEAI